ncbi:MAG: carbohydrate-binding domain-containing protein, partial [Ruminiclostridium sp.]|nr:carbohydrate-binding domain-containing protein [Ruminiclostridium sp.]
MKARTYISVLTALCLTLTACSNSNNAQVSESTENSPASSAASSSEAAVITTIARREESSSSVSESGTVTVNKSSLALNNTEMFSSRDYEIGYSDCTEITLSDSGISVSGEGASVSGNVVTINAAGSYLIKGTVSDGQIMVDADDEKVQIVLDGASVTSSGSAALYVKSADKVFVTTSEGSQNTLASVGEYVNSGDSKIDGAVFAKSDITLNGSGALTVSSETAHGIVCKDDIKITGGTLAVSAAKKGIDCNESVRIANGSISITSGTDGIHAENSDEAEKAFVYIGGGNIEIVSGGDAIDASGEIAAADGVVSITSGGGAENAPAHTGNDFGARWDRDNSSSDGETSSSAKGLRSGSIITVSGGTFVIDSSDDALHSADTVDISGGSLTAATGDDGIHSDTSVLISGGMVNITGSYEGIEGEVIGISGGTVSVRATDDGMNAAGETGSGMMNTDPNALLTISGGNVTVNADGDGLDTNGCLVISGGTTFISGPTNAGNGALDYGISGTVTGGYLIAAGAVGMAENFGSDSTQGSILYTFDGTLSAGTEISLRDSSGNVLVSYAPEKQYQCAVITAPGVTAGSTYTVVAGDSSYSVEMTSNIYGSGSGFGGGSGGHGGFGDKNGENGGFGDRGGRGNRDNTFPTADSSGTGAVGNPDDASETGTGQNDVKPETTSEEKDNAGNNDNTADKANENGNRIPPMNGEMPELPQNGEMPELPQNGEMPELPQNGQMPELPQN